MKKIIAEDKFGWPVEVTLAEAEGAWIILVDGEFFVSANKTSDEYPDAKVFKDRRSAVEAVKKNNLNKKGRVQIAFNYGYEDEVREVVTEAKKPKVNEKCERCFRQELDGLSTVKLIATFTTVDESDAIDVEPYFNRSLFIDDLVADLDGGDSCSVCESEPLAEKETDSSLKEKAALIAQRMDKGRDFSDICNDKDIYLGSLHADFVYDKYVMKSFAGSFEEYRKRELMKERSR